MWEPRRLTTLWGFTASYRDSFTFTIEVCKQNLEEGWIVETSTPKELYKRNNMTLFIG
jgi:hypothetical protein